MQQNEEQKDKENEEVASQAAQIDVEVEDTVRDGAARFLPKRYNALYLSNIVPVPGVNLTCDINNSLEADSVREAFDRGDPIVIVASRDSAPEVKMSDICPIACLCTIKRVTKSGDDVRVMVTGTNRVQVSEFAKDPWLKVTGVIVADTNINSVFAYETVERIKDILNDLVRERMLPPAIRVNLIESELNPGEFSDALVHLLANDDVVTQTQFLQELDVEKRLASLLGLVKSFEQKAALRREISDRVNENMQKTQKEMFLREQLHVINDELNGDVDENEEFVRKVKELGMPKDSEEKVIKEINRMAKLPFGSPELGYIRNFVETVLELPWTQRTDDNIDIARAREILDEEHYALDKVKERILETLAVFKLTKKVNAQIICLVGPPGVGKTSIAKSIANAMGRKFVQVSLGGVNDESVIRGHRRTYVGAMCGRILAGMKQAGTTNPVFLLDEIDKMTSDARGDPASALLEVLDPAQNDHFKDSFLELPYDLSQVMFVLTANELDTIPYALRDRMEIISLRGYTEYEKVEIAKNYLIPKEEAAAGLQPGTISLDDALIKKIITEYTFEGGVRSLERKIAAIARKYATFVVTGEKFRDICAENIEDYLGHDRVKDLDIYRAGAVGEVVGLAVVGGLSGKVMLIESTLSIGKPEIRLTGLPGEMMRESVEQVYTLVKSRARAWGIPRRVLDRNTVHVHVAPVSGGVEGPSAGIAMTTAVVSALTGIPTKPNVAMTGEISIRGRVLPIGGVRDKLIAADRAGVRLCIIPEDNAADLYDLPTEVKDRLEIRTASTIDQVLGYALERMPEEREGLGWDEDETQTKEQSE